VRQGLQVLLYRSQVVLHGGYLAGLERVRGTLERAEVIAGESSVIRDQPGVPRDIPAGAGIALLLPPLRLLRRVLALHLHGLGQAVIAVECPLARSPGNAGAGAL
jgi:hypothetical protein